MPCAVAFGAGIVAASAAPRLSGMGVLAAGICLLLLACVARRRTGPAAALVACGLFALGAGCALLDLQRVAARSWLPSDGTAIEADILARVWRAPESELDGGVSLLVSARPAGEPTREALRVGIRVEPSHPGATRDLLALRRGDRIRAWCRLRAPVRRGGALADDPAIRLWSQGLDATGTVKSARLVRKIENGSPGAGRLLDDLRARSLERLDRAVGSSGRGRAVLGAMLLGERSSLAPEDLRRLRDGGLLHLLAISGFHVSLAALCVSAALRRVTRRGWIACLCSASAVAAFVFLVGSAPPALRAGASAIVAWAGRAIGRDGNPMNALALAGCAMLAVSPGLIWNAGFELSIAATAGILALSGRLASRLPLPRAVARAAGLSVAAYAATAPILAWRFERLAPAALLSNLIAAPLAVAVLVAGILALAVADLPGAGPLAGALARWSVEGLVRLADAAESLPFGSFRVARPGGLLLFSCFGALLLARGFGTAGSMSRAISRASGLACALAMTLLHLGPLPAGEREPEVAVLDVGQGLAIAVVGPSGQCLLVDAGGTGRGRFDAGERIVVPALLRRGCRRLEAVIVTHDHDDHAGGAAAVLRDLEVGELWVGAGSHRDPRTRDTARVAVRAGAAVALAERGLRARRAGTVVEFLHPDRADAALPVNDRCVVVRLSWGAARMLVPGDLEADGEGRLLARGEPIEAAVLIVGHHGAPGSSSKAWIARVGARVAVISAGRGNRFGHPHPDVLDRLARAGCRIYRTDRDGTVLLRPSRGGFAVDTELRSGGGGWE